MSIYEYKFFLTDSKYIYYGITSSFYSLYYYLRLFVIALIFLYMACKLFSKYKNIVNVIIFTIIYVVLMFCLNGTLGTNNFNCFFKMLSTYYFELYDYGSILNETLTFSFIQ